MILIYHNDSRVLSVQDKQGNEISGFEKNSLVASLLDLAGKFPEDFLVWCEVSLQSYLNKKELADILHSENIMASYIPGTYSYFPDAIGYVEQSVFITIKKEVRYPTWRMSSKVGGIHASAIRSLQGQLNPKDTPDYFLSSFAKLAMEHGLFAYSEPKLLTENASISSGRTASYSELFRFVRQHYRVRWIFLLWLNLLVFERKFFFLSPLKALFYSRRKFKNVTISPKVLQSFPPLVRKYDVLILTIGRKKYLIDVLQDLAIQEPITENVIIIEQNPQPGELSELDYLTIQNWPFKIKHTFTNQPGACNARNIALEQLESPWIFFAKLIQYESLPHHLHLYAASAFAGLAAVCGPANALPR